MRDCPLSQYNSIYIYINYLPLWSIIITSYHIHHLIPIDTPTSSQIPCLPIFLVALSTLGWCGSCDLTPRSRWFCDSKVERVLPKTFRQTCAMLGHAVTNGANKMSPLDPSMFYWSWFNGTYLIVDFIFWLTSNQLIQYDSIYYDILWILWIRFKIAHRCLFMMNSSIFGEISSPPHPLFESSGSSVLLQTRWIKATPTILARCTINQRRSGKNYPKYNIDEYRP